MADHVTTQKDGVRDGTLQFFRRQEQELERATSSLHYPFAILTIAVLALLVLLESGGEVWAYILGLLLPVAFFGLKKSRETEEATRTAVQHIIELEERIAAGGESSDLISHLDDRVSAEDQTHAAESIRTFIYGSPTADAVPTTARAAFSETEALAESTSFFRSALILGGLFGTVLFFALELTQLSPSLIDTEELLEGLRGALVSTLTGIIGAVAIGFVANRLQQRVNKIVQETETFLGGALLPVIRREHVTPAPGTEVELWEALRKEVRNLTDRIDERTVAMGDDAAAYARSLEEVSTRLAELPQLRVPPELADLEDIVGEFSRGSELLHETTAELIEAVGALGVFAPARLLRDLDELRTEMQEWKAESRETFQATAEQVKEMSRELEQAGRRMREQTVEAIEGRMGTLDEAIARLDRSIPRMEKLLESGVGNLESAGQDIKKAREGMEDVPDQVMDVLEEFRTDIQVFRQTVESVEQLRRELARTAGAEDRDPKLDEILRRLRELEGLVDWHRSVRRGALWKLMGLPMWPEGRWPFTSGGRS